jgi:hypothetical protein
MVVMPSVGEAGALGAGLSPLTVTQPIARTITAKNAAIDLAIAYPSS